MKRKYYHLIFLIIVIVASILFSEKGIIVMKNLLNHKTGEIIVVIDAGHGGFDPGKVGINNILEKDINLSIAYKLKSLLEQNDIKVIMTRKDGKGLYTKYDKDKKRTDMKKRASIINSSDALLAVSIHQNSFTKESSWGAQVFYYQKSAAGKMLAEIIQDNMKMSLKDGNHRLAKPNNTYFMLKNSNCPLVIVECGFLSNRKEAVMLTDEIYQEKVAWAIHLGIMEYINSYKKKI